VDEIALGLSPEQMELRESVERFVRKEIPPERAKALDESGEYPADLLRSFADLGWTGLPFSDEWGGSDAGPVELAIVTEMLGRASFDVAMLFVASVMSAMIVDKFGTVEQRAALLPDLIAGRRRLSVSISEPDAGSDVAAIRTAAVRDGDDLVINGEKMWCTGAGLPDTLIGMYVRTQPGSARREGLSFVLIDPALPGVQISRIPTLARHILGTCQVVLTDVRIPVTSVVGPMDRGWDVLLSGLETERVLISGGYVGAASATLEEAVRYAKQRTQFGRPIADYQGLAHPLADLATAVHASRLLTYASARQLAAGRKSVTAGSMAKLFGSETYVQAARLGMQVWGGYGFSTESIMSFRYRESIVATISGGTSQIQRNLIARSLGLGSR
jgi:alkylation response protein AidB-like acyl-CoA dehydrogenase